MNQRKIFKKPIGNPPNRGLSLKSINRNTKTKLTPRSTKQHKQKLYKNPQTSSQLPQKQLPPPIFRCSHTTPEHQLKNLQNNQQPMKTAGNKTPNTTISSPKHLHPKHLTKNHKSQPKTLVPSYNKEKT